jgi:hypothetical protein
MIHKFSEERNITMVEKKRIPTYFVAETNGGMPWALEWAG